ncbi:HNH endonuclease [Sedimentimonas flavescens]|uniref:HNH endonuclease n=1 Tax=Sedimentimonas flavescens TaxID=2851012 RepID=UPI0021A629C5|nr:HNH endonuclease [Sedimentimonas flavescens]MCT2538747.1 HNH endonuclease [Sedimentimonas flavescens]
MTLENPQSFITRQECDKVAFQNGFRRRHDECNGWKHYSSTTAQGSIWLARDADDLWLLAIDHGGVIKELGIPSVAIEGPGLARYSFATLAQLYAVMPRLYQLANSLPDAPLQDYLHRTINLPNTTEAERLVIQRVGQEVFRERLVDYWQGECPLTGITDGALLRASHIRPWADCTSDEERLDVHNGLLLSALWDAAFDRGLVSFGDDGHPMFSSTLGEMARRALAWREPIPLSEGHRERLSWHRDNLFIR